MDEQWQIFPYNSSYFVLRTKESSSIGYLAVAVGTGDVPTPGNTKAITQNYTLCDNSMFWKISPWGDGTFYLSNAQNGTDWHLNVRDNSLISMSSNITAPQDGQRFSFTQLKEAINDPDYSTVMVSLPHLPQNSFC